MRVWKTTRSPQKHQYSTPVSSKNLGMTISDTVSDIILDWCLPISFVPTGRSPTEYNRWPTATQIFSLFARYMEAQGPNFGQLERFKSDNQAWESQQNFI